MTLSGPYETQGVYLSFAPVERRTPTTTQETRPMLTARRLLAATGLAVTAVLATTTPGASAAPVNPIRTTAFTPFYGEAAGTISGYCASNTTTAGVKNVKSLTCYIEGYDYTTDTWVPLFGVRKAPVNPTAHLKVLVTADKYLPTDGVYRTRAVARATDAGTVQDVTSRDLYDGEGTTWDGIDLGTTWDSISGGVKFGRSWA